MSNAVYDIDLLASEKVKLPRNRRRQELKVPAWPALQPPPDRGGS
jgi:hypothetical protein